MAFLRPAVGGGTTFTTTFPATENPISQGGIWLNGLTDGLDWNDIQTSTGKAYGAAFDSEPAFGSADCVAQLKRTFLACTSNQFSRGTVFSTYGGVYPGATHEIEVFCNLVITPHSITGYECYVSAGGNHTLVRWNGALTDFTPLASNNVSTFTIPVENDVIELQNINGNLACYQNGILRTTFTDTTWTGGNPGIGNNPIAGGSVAVNGIGWKSWTCGNL